MMNKLVLKNALIAFLITVTAFSVYLCLVTLKEKRSLQLSLKQTQDKLGESVKENQKLVQQLEKEKQFQEHLVSKNATLKMNIKASRERLGKAFSELNQLQTQGALLKAENGTLSTENENLKIKLSSIVELKKAIRELKRQAVKVVQNIKEKIQTDKTLEGNRGFLIKDGKVTSLEQVRIEVVPAPAVNK